MELITTKIKTMFTTKNKLNSETLKNVFSLALSKSNKAFAVNETMSKKETAISNEKEISLLKIAIRNAFFLGAGMDHR